MNQDAPVILCVEDDRDTQEMLSLLLQQQGYKVKTADNCADALRLIQENTISLVLMDNLLADGNGIDLCAQVREFNKQLPIIFLSGSVYENAHENAFKSGANAFLTKPVVLRELFAALNAFAPLPLEVVENNDSA